jgi:transporter family-2 protein
MFAAGLGVPLLAAINSQFGQFIGSPIAAVAVMLCVAFSTIVIIAIITSELPLKQIRGAPKYLLFAGMLIVFYILSITTIAPKFGVGNAVFFVLVGQLVSAAVIDHFALFGSTGSPLTIIRTLGISVMALGVWITQQA